MPRTATRTPAAIVLEFFRTASLDTALFVIELGQKLVKERTTVAAAPVQTLKPAAIKLPGIAVPVKAKAKAKSAKKVASHPAPAQAAADKPARRKPGPKPGSHRKKPGQVAIPHTTEPEDLHDQPLDLREPIPGEAVYEDDGFVPPPALDDDLEVPDYTQPSDR